MIVRCRNYRKANTNAGDNEDADEVVVAAAAAATAAAAADDDDDDTPTVIVTEATSDAPIIEVIDDDGE